MDFYDKLENDINEFFNSEQYNNLNSNNIKIEFFELKYKYPNAICELIIEDKKLFLNIITRFKKIINESSDYSYDDVIELINKPIITNLNTKKKIKCNRFEEIIKEYLFENDWFLSYYDSIKPNIENIEPNLPISNFTWRDNQKEAIDRLYKNGLETGIHCQATGTGKSYIIINYIDYVKKMINSKCKIILFTERVNILKDLFDFKDKKINKDKLNEWRINGIGDLTEFDIIDRVTIKKKDWVEILNNATKPTLLVINRAYLTLNCNSDIGYKKINKLNLIIHDECHSSTSILCHQFLKHWKNKNIPIVGFSATPLRNGKSDGEFNKDKLIEIFNDSNNKLNLLTDYNMIYSIQQELILPPKFYWYNMQTYQTKSKIKKELISEEEIGSVFSILNDVMDILPNKKIVAWCGTIKLCKEWYKQFNQHKEKIKYMFPEVFKIETFIDNSESKTNDYQTFREKESYSILFCAQKHREGSDIKKLDSCIFLDKVKNRGSIPFIQSIGRVLRKVDTDPNKFCGIIIDGVVKDNDNYDKVFVDKILGYYFALANLTNEDGEDKYEAYAKIRDVVKFDKENKIININVSNVTIPINCKKLDWANVVSKFSVLLEKKVNLTPEEAFQMYINKLKTIESFMIPENDFWEEYKKLDHERLNLPEDIYEPYKHIWETKTWYDILGFKYYNYTEFINFITVYKINSNKKLHNYLKKNNSNKFPYYPEEYYRLSGWNNWDFDNNDLLL